MSKNYFVSLALAVMFLFATNARADWTLDLPCTVKDNPEVFGFTVGTKTVGGNFLLVGWKADVSNPRPEDLIYTDDPDWAWGFVDNSSVKVGVDVGALGLDKVTGFSIEWTGTYSVGANAIWQLELGGEHVTAPTGWSSSAQWVANIGTGVYGKPLYFTIDDFNALLDDNGWLNIAFNGGHYSHFVDGTQYIFTFYGDKSSTPEPATLAVLGLGLAGVGLVARRRNKK